MLNDQLKRINPYRQGDNFWFSGYKGKFHKGSDIDVCIVSPKFKSGVEALQFSWLKRNKKEIMAGLEPVGFSVKDFEEGSSLIQEIKKTGVTL